MYRSDGLRTLSAYSFRWPVCNKLFALSIFLSIDRLVISKFDDHQDFCDRKRTATHNLSQDSYQLDG